MNIISCCQLLLILITQGIHVSEQMTHTNKSSPIDACKGNDVDLIWKVDEEENKISKLEWYFKNTSICTSSRVEPFTVTTPYQGRIERINITEIRLKNVSMDDEGIYTLFPLLDWTIFDDTLKIELRILEPPTNYCTCKMGHQPDFTSEPTESYCGRPQVTLVWKRKQTFEVLGEGNRILNSTLQDKEVLCCLDGEAMKCVDDKRQSCTTVSIPHRDTERPSEDGNTQHTDSVTMPGTGTESTNIHHMQLFVLHILSVSLLTALLVLALLALALFIRNYKKRKNYMDVERRSYFLGTVQERHADIQLDQIQDDTDSSETSESENTLDCPLQDSNQRVQNVNNISIDTDFLKSMFHSNTALMAELQASRKETRKLKRQLHREKHLRPRSPY